MKKFFSRALPLCLALLIFVGSMVVPAFAFEIPPDLVVIPEESLLASGTWCFDSDARKSTAQDWVFGDFLYDGVSYGVFYAYGYTISFGRQDDAGEWVGITLRDNSGTWLVDSLVFECVAPANCSDVFYSWFSSVASLTESPLITFGTGVSIFSVFSGISGWIVSSIGTIMPMFYAEATGLTFIGTLAVAALALGVCFLIVALIRRFMNFG